MNPNGTRKNLRPPWSKGEPSPNPSGRPKRLPISDTYIAMPVLDGFSAVREIRKFMPDVSILVLSMHRGKRAIQEAKSLGAQGFVSKSELAGTLLNAVDVIARKQTLFRGR